MSQKSPAVQMVVVMVVQGGAMVASAALLLVDGAPVAAAFTGLFAERMGHAMARASGRALAHPVIDVEGHEVFEAPVLAA